MQICWDNLEKLRFNKEKGVWYKSPHEQNALKYVESCKVCGEPFLGFPNNIGFCSYHCSLLDRHPSEESRKKMSVSRTGEKNHGFGKHHTQEHNRKIGDAQRAEKGSNWKGGVTKKNIPLFNTFAPKLSWCEATRRDPEDNNILQVKCTYCGKWYMPTLDSVRGRIKSANGKMRGDSRLYCSNECKKLCPIYRRVKYSGEEKHVNYPSREVQAQLRQMVFERDNWTCIKCNNTKALHCHHKEGIYWEPLESADINMCVTLCKDCHKEVHKQDGCEYKDFQCN